MKLKEKIKKIITSFYFLMMMLFSASTLSYADSVSITSNGGKIRESALGSGVFNLAQDIAGTLRWLIPVISIPFILWFLFKMFSGEEQEQPRYKKKLITTLIIVMATTLVTVILNLVMGYFTA